MRTHDEKLMEGAYRKMYVRENASVETDEPLIVWVTKRLGKNLPQDLFLKPLLLKMIKSIVNDEQKKKVPKVMTARLAGAPVPITPDSFPSSSVRQESLDVLAYLRENLAPEDLEAVQSTTPPVKSDSQTAYKDMLDFISKSTQHENQRHTPP